jgi:hypothetical protein
VSRSPLPASSFAALFFVTLMGAATAQPHSATITGRVLNSTTRQPIARAQVYSPDNRFAVMTDDQGRFEVPLPPTSPDGGANAAPSISIMARKPGYQSDPFASAVLAQFQPDAPELTILLTPEAILMGHVNLSPSESADGVPVQLFHRQVSEGTARWVAQNVNVTDSQGDFRFADLSAGDYRLGTREAGDRDPQDVAPGGKMFSYPPVYFPGASDFSSAATIHLTPGKVFEAPISLSKQPYFPVKISLSAPANVAQVNVNVSLQGDEAPGYSLGYNPADQTIRGSLPNGTYVVEASTFSPTATGGTMTLRVANGAAETGQITMLTPPSIEVRVREEFTATQEQGAVTVTHIHGMPSRHGHQYLQVTLEPISDFTQRAARSLRPPRTANDESLAIDDVPPGRYWVRVSSARGYAASVASGNIDLIHAPLVVGPVGSTSPIEITMRDDMASFDASVEGISPNPSASGTTAYVYWIPLPDSEGQFAQVWAGVEGKLNSQIVPGTYRVLAFDHPKNDLEYRNPDAMRAYESKGQIVQFVAGQTEHLQLQIISAANEDAN